MLPDGAAEWIHQHVRHVEAIEVAQEWELSTVLRVRTANGDLYFKSSARLPLSADEPKLMALLARLYPDDLPVLIALDTERGWLLIADAGTNLRELPHDDLWHKALMRLVQLQHDSAAHIEQILAAGCHDWRPDRLAAMIDTLLADERMLAGLEADERQRLRAFAPTLHRNCQELKLETLIHGDFHGANIGYKDGRLRFFDWTESAVSHPFFDLPVLLHDAAAHFSAEQVAALRDDYLACWEDGQRQWQIAAPLAALHHAMMYNGVAVFMNPNKPRVRVTRWLREILSHDA